METEKRNMREEVRRQFDDTLARHVTATVEASQGESLPPFNLGTLSCLVLLAGRESELDMFPSDPPERYTKKTFLEGLEEMGLPGGQGLQEEVDGLIQRGLIGVGSDGTFSAHGVAMDLARRVDEAFPGMPGINLVAYLIQTIDEVLSGRKAVEFAIRQLDQTLTMYGAKKGGQTKKDASSAGTASSRPSPAANGASTESIKSALSATLRKRSAARPGGSPVSSQPKIVTANGEVKALEIRDLFPKSGREQAAVEVRQQTEVEPLADSLSHASIPERDADDPLAVLPTQYGGDGADQAFAPQESVSPSEGPFENEATTTAAVEESIPVVPTEGQPADGTVDEPAAVAQMEAAGEEIPESKTDSVPESARVSDEALAERITAFEEGLAMTCPMCGQGRIQPKETSKGKTFYVCSNQACVFVSWGKPYHEPCPRCSNPFLVEAEGQGGRRFLRCPRATCRHRQPMPGDPLQALSEAPAPRSRRLVGGASPGGVKKKRVVRRRVVRKKR